MTWRALFIWPWGLAVVRAQVWGERGGCGGSRGAQERAGGVSSWGKGGGSIEGAGRVSGGGGAGGARGSGGGIGEGSSGGAEGESGEGAGREWNPLDLVGASRTSSFRDLVDLDLAPALEAGAYTRPLFSSR